MSNISTGEKLAVVLPELLGANNIAAIRLKGHPYEQVLANGEIVNATDALEELAVNTRYAETLANTIESRGAELEGLYSGGFYGLDEKVKNPAALTYEDAYSLIAFVCLTSNHELARQLGPRMRGYDLNAVGEETLRLHAVSLL